MMRISIADDFSRYPAGRTHKDGPDNGLRFRRDFLVPGLKKVAADGGQLEVAFDGVRSYGSSFLEEAFGGLVREEGYSAADLARLLVLRAEKPVYETYRKLALKCILDAERT